MSEPARSVDSNRDIYSPLNRQRRRVERFARRYAEHEGTNAMRVLKWQALMSELDLFEDEVRKDCRA